MHAGYYVTKVVNMNELMIVLICDVKVDVIKTWTVRMHVWSAGKDI